MTLLLVSFIRVVCTVERTIVLSKPVHGPSLVTTIASTLSGITINEVLFGKLVEGTIFDGVVCLNRCYTTERPATTTRSLALDLVNDTPLAPIDFSGRFRVSRNKSVR